MNQEKVETMKLSFRLFNRRLLFLFRAFKTRTAIGIKSTVPNSDKHILLFDIDDGSKFAFAYLQWIKKPLAWYRSPHGFHLIVFEPFSLIDAAKHLLDYCDKDYVACGLRRGYWFLETYGNVKRNRKGFDVAALNFQRIERHA